MKFCKFIKENRKKYGFSQEDLSKQLNVSRATIARWENESLVPSKEYAHDLAEIFNVDEKEIIKMIETLKSKRCSNCNWQYIVISVLTFSLKIVISTILFLRILFVTKKVFNGFFYYDKLFAFSVFECSDLAGKILIFVIPIVNIITFVILTIKTFNEKKTRALKIILLSLNIIYIIVFSLLIYFGCLNKGGI